MLKIKTAMYGITHEHAAGKMQTLLRMSDIFEFVGCVDDTETSKVRFNAACDVVSVFDGQPRLTEAEMFAMPDLQLVLVETANSYLISAATKVMEHGLAMHMDKPPTEDLAAYRELLDGCRARRLPFQMGYMFRGNPAIRFVIDAVRGGLIGEVHTVHADMHHDYGDEAYRAYLANFKGGIMYNLGCHLIDIVVAMLGAPAKAAPFLRSCGTAGIDNAVAVLEYPRALVTLAACGCAPGSQPRRELAVYGSAGSLLLRPIERFDAPQRVELHLTRAADGYAAGAHTIEFPALADRYESQLRELADAIRGGAPLAYSHEHDYTVLAATLAASGIQ